MSKLQRGFTIIELIIGMVIGLVILTGISAAFLAGQQTQQIVNAQSKLQENGRFALSFVFDALSKAGYRDDASQMPIQVFDTFPVLFGRDSTVALTLPTSHSSFYDDFAKENLTLSVNGFDFVFNSIETHSDLVAIQYISTNELTTCTGNVGGDPADATIPIPRVEAFYITYKTSTTDGSRFELQCKGWEFDGSAWNESDNTPLADDLIDFQVTYGVDTDDDYDANQYISWVNTMNPLDVVSLNLEYQLKGAATVNNADNMGSVSDTEVDLIKKYTQQIHLRNIAR